MVTYNDKTQYINGEMEKENTAEWESVAVALGRASVKAGQMWKVHGNILEGQRVKIGPHSVDCAALNAGTMF
jgi:hypothetical protein